MFPGGMIGGAAMNGMVSDGGANQLYVRRIATRVGVYVLHYATVVVPAITLCYINPKITAN